MITNEKLVFSIKGKKTKNEILEEISKKLVEEKIALSLKPVLNGFKKREKDSTTGLADGIAIPHVSSKEISEAKIVVVKLEEDVDWKSLDGKPTNLVIAIVVPESGRNEHFELLTSISAKLADPKFVESFKKASVKEITKIINSIKVEKKAKKSEVKGRIKVVGVTTCITGVAHTFLAAKALEDEGDKRGWNVRIEKQGQMTKDILTKKEIDEADYVIIAKSKNIDNAERFNGKLVYTTEVAKPITKAAEVFDAMIEKSSIQSGKQGGSSVSSVEDGVKSGKVKEVMNHLMAGISFMIPYIAMAGITLGLTTAFGFEYKDGVFGPKNHLANAFNVLAGQAFTLYIPILAMYIANSISGRKSMAPAAILALVLNQGITPMLVEGSTTEYVAQFAPFYNWGTMSFMFTNVSPALGFLGAVVAGYMIGYSVKWFTTQTDKVESQVFQSVLPLLLIPVLFTTIPFMFMMFIGYLPLFYLAMGLNFLVQLMADNHMLWLAGGLMGAMICFDLGGPVNKIAMTIGVAMMMNHDSTSVLNGVAATAVSIPAFVLMFSWAFSRFTPLKMDEQDMTAAGSATVMGMFGITEGAIPFAAKDPKKWIPSFMIAGLVGGILASFTGVVDNVAMWGGPIIWASGGFGSTHIPLEQGGVVTSNWTWTLLYFIPLIVAGFVGFLTASGLEFAYTKKELKNAN